MKNEQLKAIEGRVYFRHATHEGQIDYLTKTPSDIRDLIAEVKRLTR